jgi:hypothetical protein
MQLPLPRADIVRFLQVRTVLRLLVVVTFYGCVAMALARWLVPGSAFVQSRGYVALMALAGLAAIAGGLLLRIARCPSCGGFFAVRADGKRRNNFTSHCLNCGLALDGSNLPPSP